MRVDVGPEVLPTLEEAREGTDMQDLLFQEASRQEEMCDLDHLLHEPEDIQDHQFDLDRLGS